MRRSLLCWLVVCLSSRASADEVRPAAGAEARLLTCGYMSRVDLSVFTWEEEGGRQRLRHRRGRLDTGAAVPRRTGKPPVGCAFGLPTPAAAWELAEVTRWERTDEGWFDAGGRRVELRCQALTLSAVRGGTALVANPRSEGCGASRQLLLTGGPRVQAPVVRCTLTQKGAEPLTLTFGAELVRSDNDCGGGSDWRVHDQPELR